MTWKSATFLVLTAGASLIGIKELITENEEAVNVAKEEIKEPYLNNSNFTGPYTEIDSSSGLGSETGTTWEPSPVPVNGPTENYNWGVSDEQKIKNREEAGRVYGTLNDYAFKMFLPCGNGTGWILDYEIPAEGKYPTKWYIATNLHVIFDLRFSEDTYKQKIPFADSYVKKLRRDNKEAFEKALKGQGELKNKCQESYKFGYFDMNIGQQDTGREKKANVGGIAKGEMVEPKLFYAAFNFLDKNKVGFNNHFADFAVVEIDFTSEEAARKATSDFADKYKDKHPINLFAEPLEKKYNSRQEWVNSKDNYYILAYPNGPSDEFAYTKNWNEDSSIASHFGGFASAKNTSVWGKWTRKFIWYGEEYKEFGHRYSFSHNTLGAGASGGLYVDGNGNAVGIIIQGSRSINWAQPFRSVGTKEEQHEVTTPAYDLILGGADGQRNSYKQQVIANNRKTWLSTMEGWNKQ